MSKPKPNDQLINTINGVQQGKIVDVIVIDGKITPDPTKDGVTR